MKFYVTRFTIEDNLQHTGDDCCFLHIFVRTAELDELALPVILSYDELRDFIQEQHPAVGRYLTRIRSGISGYGPKHSKVFATLHEENFDLSPYIAAYIESKDEVFVEQHLQSSNRKLGPEVQKSLKETFEQLAQFVNKDYVAANIGFDEFMDRFDQTVHELCLDSYPKLFDQGDKHIFMYRRLLQRTTLSFCGELDRILHGKFPPYWEEDYERQKRADDRTGTQENSGA